MSVKINIPTPKSIYDKNVDPLISNRMCRTCAYHTPLTSNEINYEKSMMNLRPHGYHLCHERPNTSCFGSKRTVEKLRKEGALEVE